MSETRVRAATLLSKVFLHYLVLLSGTNELFDLWLKIITILDRLGNSGQGDNLEEAVSENLKNMLLVLNDGGYLAPPEEKPEQEDLWIETWKRINRFQPGLLKELFPGEVDRPRKREGRNEEVRGGVLVEGKEVDVAIRGVREDADDDGAVEGGEKEVEKEG
jgi:brefeldin A-resistance guanine nucleotide exchange factor 1